MFGFTHNSAPYLFGFESWPVESWSGFIFVVAGLSRILQRQTRIYCTLGLYM